MKTHIEFWKCKWKTYENDAIVNQLGNKLKNKAQTFARIFK